MADDIFDEKPKKHEDHKKHVHKQYMEHTEHKKSKNYETAAWTLGIVAVILAILFVVALATQGFSRFGISGTSGTSGKSLSKQEVQTKTIDYLNNLFKAQGQQVTVAVDEIKDEGDIYSLKLNISGKTYDSFVRKDGSFLFPSGIDLTQKIPDAAPAQTQPTPTENIPKTDKPAVELFVMAYCPYGTQAEKGILPAIRALGNKVDFKVRFVYYAMHGKKEVDENLRQYCIQKEQPGKYNSYLACFLNASDSPACLKSVGVDTTALDTCVSAADKQFDVTKNFNDQASWLSGQFPLFNTDKDLNTKYSIGGSPTLIINGVQSSAGRSASSYLKAICNAMTTPGTECDATVDSAQPSPGFGYGTSAAATAAGCGV